MIKIQTFTDKRDGNLYKYRKIGNQTWMTENYRYKPTSGFWDIGNKPEFAKKNGILYQFEKIKKDIPSGWKIPTVEDWKILFFNLGNNPAKVTNYLLNDKDLAFNCFLGGHIDYKTNTIKGLYDTVFFMTSSQLKINTIQCFPVAKFMLNPNRQQDNFDNTPWDKISKAQNNISLNEISKRTLSFHTINCNVNDGFFIRLIKAENNVISQKNPTLLEQASSFHNRKIYDAAIILYRQYLSANPNDYKIWYNLGVAYRQSGNVNEEINCNKRVISLNSQFTPALANLGYSYFVKKDFQNAINFFEKLAEIDPQKYYKEVCNIAIISHKSGNFEKAIKYYELTLVYQPNYKPALTNLKWAKQNKWV